MRAKPVSAVSGSAILTDWEALAEGGAHHTLRRGEVLVRQGDPSDTLYFVLSGRFTVHVDGVAERIAEIGQGQPIGEIGFFAGLPRTATVTALRDSSVLAITREQFEEFGKTSPGFANVVIVALARRLSQNIGTAVKGPAVVRTIAVVSAGGSEPSALLLERLRAVFGAPCRSTFLTERDVASKLPGVTLDDPATSNWLNSLEVDFDFIFYLADPTLTDWTRKCIRQADALMLVAMAGAPSELNPSERFAFSIQPNSARHLLILHDARTVAASGTGRWLEHRDVSMHHHVALQDAADIKRIFRFLSGRATGFVAGGGGALGSAHVGAYKALAEAGADFDILGGTSVGAAIMAAFACGADPERVDQGTHNIFVKSRAFRRPTLPRYGLIDHTVFDRALHAEYGDLLIEDLWRPFFALSSNLSRHRPMIHRRGPVWQAVRASGSIPGVLPPFFTAEGEMLVDGALMDNVPLAPMKALKTGPNVVVILGGEFPETYSVKYESIPGARELVAAMLNPFSRRRLPRAPGILQVIMMSMLANRPTDLHLGETDVLVQPDLPANLGHNSWERHNEIFMHAYRSVAAWIAAQSTQTDARLRVVINNKG
jgi:NTE family protein